MEAIKNEILQVIKAFSLGQYKGLKTIDNNYLNKYTFTEFYTDKGTFKHYFAN